MREVFADASFLIARSLRGDRHHAEAFAAIEKLGRVQLFTTEEVLIEYLNYFAAWESHVRSAAAVTVRGILSDPAFIVLPRTEDQFEKGLELYERRPDKGYSLTDCISMNCMRTHGIVEILTTDHHFQQEGFVILLKT